MTTPIAISITDYNTTQLEDIIEKAKKALSDKTKEAPQTSPQQPDQSPQLDKYNINDTVYALDTTHHWFEAYIISRDDQTQKYKVHYKHFITRFDETINYSDASLRLTKVKPLTLRTKEHIIIAPLCECELCIKPTINTVTKKLTKEEIITIDLIQELQEFINTYLPTHPSLSNLKTLQEKLLGYYVNNLLKLNTTYQDLTISIKTNTKNFLQNSKIETVKWLLSFQKKYTDLVELDSTYMSDINRQINEFITKQKMLIADELIKCT